MSADGVQLGVVLLCHDRLDMAARMARIWAEGGAAVMVHVDARVAASDHEAMVQALKDQPLIAFSPRRACNWGRFDLVQATQEASRQLLDQQPAVSHVYLASGSCLPLRPVAELTDYLRRHPTRDHIESVAVADAFWAMGGLNEERFTRYFPFDWRHQRWRFDRFLDLQRWLGIQRRLPAGLVPHLGSQWWCLTRHTLDAILSDPDRAAHDRFFRLAWIPDEGYFQTLARKHSPEIESRSLTLARFDLKGKPYLLYDDHRQLLEASGAFVARKVWPGATGLMDHFPKASAAGTSGRHPDPRGIDQLFAQAAERRARGRPGLRSQGRFPNKGSENQRTAAPYALFQGFDAVIPGFEDWLAGQLDADVHGHLFHPDRAEFAGRPDVGPGALSSNPTLRDYHPEAFLASLIRSGNRMQVFQHGPADDPGPNWFIAGDANARLSVITGAWVVPLFRAALPTVENRKTAALLQRAEIEQAAILNSPSIRAQVKIWDLADFVARPEAILAEALGQIDPAISQVQRPLPPIPDLSGLGDFLQRLRNAGLRPALTGSFPPTDASTEEGPTP